jgi:iron transport multicopper oxidase
MTSMSLSQVLSIPFALSFLVAPSLGAIGPTADLNIVNMNVAPDGFSRSAISAGGDGVVGSLITANKGDTLSITVVNDLNDDTMLESTSIVSAYNYITNEA